MPNANRSQTAYVPTGNPDTVNASTLYAGGELGAAYDWRDRTYQIVKLDSGATSTAQLAPAANQLLFWKDKAAYLVTNDYRFSQGGSTASSYANNVAGILRNAATAGNYIHILVRGRNIAVKAATGAVATRLRCNISTPVADAYGETVGTAPVYQELGVVKTATDGTNVYADIDITNIP